ncbi:MAG: S41 family peptidase [Verrucomicrobiales bacterium]
MRALIPLLCLALPVTTAVAQSSDQPPRSEVELVDTLDQDNLQEAIRILLRSYIKRDNLDSLELNRSALQGLLDRSGFGVALVDRKSEVDESSDPQQLVAESLSDSVCYLRPGTFSDPELGEISQQLRKFEAAGSKTLILDLRVPAREATFESAARVLDHFCPPDQLLFKIQKPGEDQPSLFLSKSARGWDGELIVLIDAQTPPASEAIATVLKRMRAPLLVGHRTPGKTVEYEKVIISEEAYLRFAVAELVFADDGSIFRTGLKPDLEVELGVADKSYIFSSSREEGMKSFVFSKQQPRLNEAALVAGTNPELDYAIAHSAGRDTGYDTVPIHDRVVQAALDYLVTAELLGSTVGSSHENPE